MAKKKKQLHLIGKKEFIFNFFSLVIIIGIGLYFGARSMYYYSRQNMPNKDGSITDSNPDETNETNLILKKSSTNIKNEDYNLNYMINNFHISNDDSSKE